MRALVLMLCGSTTGCNFVLNADEYDYEPPLACDGSPAYSDVRGDGSLLLTGEQTYGLPSSEEAHSFTYACVRDNARLQMCAPTLPLALTGASASILGGGGVRPLTPGADTLVQLQAATTDRLAVLIDTTQTNVQIIVVAPEADVILTTKGLQFLTIVSIVARSLVVAAEGSVILRDDAFLMNGAILGAGSVVDVAPTLSGVETGGAPGPIALPECP